MTAAAGAILQAAGAVNSAIGSFYAAKSQKYQYRSAALSADFDASVSLLNARQAEIEAQSLLAAGASEIAQLSAAAGQQQAAVKASVGARGIVGNVGSAAEVNASNELSKQIDMLTANTNRVRAAEASRTRGAQYQANAILSRASAENLRRTAKAIKPWAVASSSLLGSSGQLASSWYSSTSGSR